MNNGYQLYIVDGRLSRIKAHLLLQNFTTVLLENSKPKYAVWTVRPGQKLNLQLWFFFFVFNIQVRMLLFIGPWNKCLSFVSLNPVLNFFTFPAFNLINFYKKNLSILVHTTEVIFLTSKREDVVYMKYSRCNIWTLSDIWTLLSKGKCTKMEFHLPFEYTYIFTYTYTYIQMGILCVFPLYRWDLGPIVWVNFGGLDLYLDISVCHWNAASRRASVIYTTPGPQGNRNGVITACSKRTAHQLQGTLMKTINSSFLWKSTLAMILHPLVT